MSKPLYDDSAVTLPLNIHHLPARSLAELARFFASLASRCADRAQEQHELDQRARRINDDLHRLDLAGRGELIDETMPAATVDANMRAWRRRRR